MPSAAPIGGTKGFKGVVKGVSDVEAGSAPDIVDVRRSLVETDLKADVLSMFNPTTGPRQLPTLLLYNERGLQLFEEVTYFVCRHPRDPALTSRLDHLPGRVLPDKL